MDAPAATPVSGFVPAFGPTPARRQQDLAPAAAPAEPTQTYAERRAPSAEPSVDVSAMTSMMSAAIAQAKESAAVDMHGMMSELRAMRGLMETQLAELSWNATAQRQPHKATVLRELLGAGFSATLAKYLVEKMPATDTAEQAMRWIKTVLARNLNTIGNDHHHRQAGRALRDAPRPGQAGPDHHRCLSYRRP
jgi:flagellar biosynthesis protein FlhF